MIVTDESVAGSEMTGTKEATVECGVAPPWEGTQIQLTKRTVFALATSLASGDVKVKDILASV